MLSALHMPYGTLPPEHFWLKTDSQSLIFSHVLAAFQSLLHFFTLASSEVGKSP